MDITLNNRKESFDSEALSIREILKLKNFTFRMMVIKLNGQLVKKGQYEDTMVKTGDRLEVIHMISGG